MFDPGTRRALGELLSGALLAGAWTERAMVRRSREALAGRSPWVRPRVRDVLAASRRPPLARRRELAAYVELVLEEARSAEPPAPPRVRRAHVFEPQMGPAPWPVPALATL